MIRVPLGNFIRQCLSRPQGYGAELKPAVVAQGGGFIDFDETHPAAPYNLAAQVIVDGQRG